ncbi:response regulator [Massilia sp. IC2-476]|uniref:hybrid sensor histidine kinase/response regulator n=1 Tax=Massilia sp. IC2-476 TaxID=2887199 RepID=UPI001D110B9F|nr:response regulator [Massilia sp. IC2-476]MCC2975037.1 response regulator [Massilia sp. IC2-476]
MSKIVWPASRSEAAELIRKRDWSSTSLGPIDNWPPLLRTLVDVILRSPASMALVWGDDRILLYNDGYARVCGARHPDVLGARVRDAWPEAWDFNQEVFDACFQGEDRVFRDAHFVLERNGAPQDVWFDLYYGPATDDAGAVRGVLCTVLETTDRVRAEQQRQRHEAHLEQVNSDLDALRVTLEQANRRLSGDMEFLNTLFRQAPSFMAVLTGPEHVFELANDAYLKLVQHRPVLGKPVRLALPELAGQGFYELLDSVYHGGDAYHGRNIEVQLDRGNGEGMERRILDFVYQPLKDAAGRTQGIFVEGVDVTDHALTEERLRVAQEAGEIGTFEWYPSTGKVVVSDAYRRIWGFAPDIEITADLLVSRVEPSHLHLAGPNRLGNESNPLGFSEFVITRADSGERRWIARRGQAVPSTIAGERRYLGVAFDITERKRTEENLQKAQAALRELNEALERQVVLEEAERFKAEDALRQAHKMEAVGQLASGVAHDFNNVLQIISSNLQLMELDGIGSVLGARVASAVAAVERGSKLSSQLLAFARRQPLQPVATDLGRLLSDMESLLLRALGDRVVLDLRRAPGLWNARVDRNQLENAILNMAINARDAMGGNGRLTISVGNAEPGSAAAGHVLLSIMDTGCGMTPEVLDKVFDPFYTTKAPGKGTGLGMSMVYGFVKQSGGEIRIESSPGNGTRIVIQLPRAEGDALHARPAGHAEVPGGDETILVVDDDAAVVATTIELLAGLGYQVLSAGSGQEAVAILRTGMPVDLLFSDLSMPGAVDCASLVAQCRQLSPHTRILLTSGQVPDGSIDAGIELLPKPYSREQLAQAVRGQLGAARLSVPMAAPAVVDEVVRTPVAADGARRILVVEDDPDTRELACELLAALGHAASGSGSAEHALTLLQEHEVDILFTDLNLPRLSGTELASRAIALRPALQVILTSGEGNNIQVPPDSGIIVLPKPYDLLQLELSIAQAAAEAGETL